MIVIKLWGGLGNQMFQYAFGYALEDVVFVTRDSKYEVIADLMGISKCSHAIMSPSTFSWWGNWLRTKTKNNIVIVPKGKYANEYFARSSWIQI